MKNIVTLVLTALFLVAPGGGIVGASDPIAPGPPRDADPVYIESTDILYLESYPVQVVLVVSGSLPTPCHELGSQVQVFDDAIDVQLWSVADHDRVCIQVLELFEVSIPLGDLESASLPVFVNGDEVGRIESGTAPTGIDLALVGGGWSYGMCLGYCLADLEIYGHSLIATGRSHMDEQPLYQNEGTLTLLGQDRLDAALATVAGVPLDAVYGCADCADGGAAYLALAEGPSASRVEIQADQPPEILAGTYLLVTTLIDALATCAQDDLVVIDADCAPYQAP